MGSFARLFTVGAVTALSASALVVSPATADTSPVPAPPATTPASSTPETRKKAKKAVLRVKIKGAPPAGAGKIVRVTGPKQRPNGKRFSKGFHQTKTFKVRPGKYTIKARTVTVTGGTYAPKKATKTVRVRKNKKNTRTVRYVFYADTPAPTLAPTPVPPVTCAKGGTCVLGDTGTGGGTVFHVDEGAAPGSRYIEAAPNTWNGDSADPAIAWCSNTTTLIAGTFGTAIGTGKTNTDNMIAPGACTSGAANIVRAYSGGGVEWSLPSQDELIALDVWSFQNSNAGGLVDDFYYWSSSQGANYGNQFGIDDPYAFVQKVGGGGGSAHHYAGYKHSWFSVRAVRAF